MDSLKLRQRTTEVVVLFKENGVPTNILLQNGETTFYRLKKMTKDEVNQLLEVDKIEV